MSNSSTTNYIHYLKDVLGIKHLFFSPPNLANKKLTIKVQELNSYSAAEKDLLEKMVAALKLSESIYLIVDMSSGTTEASEFELYLIDSDQSEVSDHIVKTCSPRLLLKRPELKKGAWANMQHLIKQLS